MPRQPSIRDRLEANSWQNHPRFSERFSRHSCGRPQRRLGWQDRSLLILASVLLLLLIVRIETASADGASEPFWGMELQAEAGGQRMLALDTSIDIEVTGLLARISVTQVFRNGGLGWMEAIYRYPLPEGAAVDRLKVEVADRVLEGEIQEKAEARRTYQQASAEGRVASLVEQQRANQFETRLANIPPGEDIHVSISFQVPVAWRDGEYSLRMPMTFTPRWEGGVAGKASSYEVVPGNYDDHFLTIEARLNPGFALASLESLYHDIDIHPTLDGYHVFLADPDTRTDREFALIWEPEYGSSPQATLTSWDDGDAVYALLMLTPPLAEAIAPQPREVVFIIDTSGSMSGASMEQARQSLLQGLEYLGPDDHFNLVRFSSETELLFEESVPASTAYQLQAQSFIEDLHADGGTVMAPALRAAMGLPAQQGLLRQIVFITDGSVGNEHELLLQIGEQLQDSRLFTVSIGSAPNAWFMRKAAEIGRGSHTRIGQQTEVSERMASLWARIENPAVQNICVDWGMDAEFYPEIVPDLYAGEPLWLYARLPLEPGEVTVCGELEGRYWETRSTPLPGGGNSDLAGRWARSKIEALEDSRLFGADPDEVRREALDLALEFGLLSRYTSLVAVDRSPSRPQGEKLQSGDIPSLLPAGSTTAAGFSNTATGWPLQLLLATLSLLVAAGFLLYQPPSRKSMTGGARSPMASHT